MTVCTCRQWRQFSCVTDTQCRQWNTGDRCCQGGRCCYQEEEEVTNEVTEEVAEEEYARIVEQGRLAVLELERMAAAEADQEAWIDRQIEAAAEEGQQRIANAEQAQELERVDYDIAIPSQHSYLG